MSALTYARLDLRRQLRDKANMFFVVALPAFLYLVFGTGGSDPIGSANSALWVTISMACYGAVTATTSIAGSAAMEQTMGWGRQLALTPLSPASFIALKTGIAVSVAAVPIAVIYFIGAVTGARGTWDDWVFSALIALIGSSMFAIYGLAVSLNFNGTNATSIASGSIVILSFLGNLFIPLTGTMLAIARFTPLYGFAGLARYPLGNGELSDGSHDPLWVPVLNVVVWTLIFIALALWGIRRGRERT